MAIDERVNSLSYRVRGRAVAKYSGQLGLAIALLTLVPMAASLVLGDYAAVWRYALVIAVLSALCAPVARLSAPTRLQINEALVIAALAFVVAPLAMTYPLMGAGLPFMDALFEAVSGVTTTGLTTLSNVEDKTAGFLFARAWLQWYGGLGIVVLSLALVIGPGAAARRLARAMSEGGDLVTGTRIHAQRIVLVYLVMTAVGVVLVWSWGIDPFVALIHTLSAVSTGGFSCYNNSLAGLGGWPVQGTLILLCVTGAIPLAFYHRAYRLNWREGAGPVEVIGLLAAAVIATLALGLSMYFVDRLPAEEVLRNAPLVAVSAQTGAGFTSMSPAQLDNASKLVLIVSMAIGGGIGSTAGGIKVLRLVILLRMLQLLLQRTRLPGQAVVEPRLWGNRLEHREIEQALLIILLFALVIGISWFPFLALGYAPMDALFDVVSATATVGLSTGVTSAALPASLKALLCVDMLLGRLEVVALLLLIYPGTWLGKRVQ